MIKNNLVLRSITGLLFVAILVFAIVYGIASFVILFTIITALTTNEFCRIVTEGEKSSVRLQPTILMVASAYLFIAFFVYCTGIRGAEVFVPYLILLMGMLIRELYLKQPDPIGNWAYSALSQLYIALPFALLNTLSITMDPINGSISYNYLLPLSIFIFLWMNDTGAFCFGSLFGKHRLFERISPKKSWEGFYGGVIVAIASGISLSFADSMLTMIQWAGLALIVAVFGTWGDLVESLLKRHLGIKDSGSILPGHGGMLDRFDSSLMAIPAAVCYLYITQLFTTF